jgi:methyl-accepting chemotaxis protein
MIGGVEVRAQELSEMADKLRGTLQQVSSTVQQVASSAEATAQRSGALMEMALDARQHLGETEEVLKFIRSVAQRTKLLGFNAAIEAARAGEHGRGFAVVANEVRKLAENSSSSVEKTAPVLHNISSSMKTITEGVEETGSVVQEQATATHEVARSIVGLEQMAHALTELAHKLTDLI